MRTVAVSVYQYSELSEKAKDNARQWYRTNQSDDYSDYENSITAISNVIGAKAKWSIGLCSYSYLKFDFDSCRFDCGISDLRGVRAMKWVWNNWIRDTLKGKYYGKLKGIYPNCKHIKRYSKAVETYDCPLTGFCADMNLYEAYQWMQRQVKQGSHIGIEDFVHELEARLCREWTSEMEARDSDEYIDEQLCGNDYEFLENGQPAAAVIRFAG